MISVIVPAFNATMTLPACLAALQAQTLPAESYEIILVDDGSTDGTATIGEAAGVRVVRRPHAGPAAARNAGVGLAQGEIIVFTDADCAPTHNWLAELTRPFSDPALVGVRGAYRTHQREWVARFVQQEYQDKYDRMAQRDSIDFIDTYSAAYRRGVFLENGGFSTAFTTASVEDQEFSFRLAQRGYRLVFVPAAVVYHRHDVSLAEYMKRKFWIGYWKTCLLRRHPGKILSDSHTPFVQRLQLGLFVVVCACALSTPLIAGLGWVCLTALLLFFASALPFGFKLARRDPPVLLVAPFLLLARAAALSAGLVVGSVSHFRHRGLRTASANRW